ncbi:MAG: exodeoxyribonuclease VII large subunit [Methanocalculaceae archaeon]|jgi:exodeoxyribonuclease VII large subunit|nr:exodeoxyribonuclease VII large subunit [Methanocalculaceae archaeon]
MTKKGQQMQLTLGDTKPDEVTQNIITPVLKNSTFVKSESQISNEPTVLNVSDLVERIRDAIDTPLLTNICVQGEIIGYRPHSSGHMYFSLSESEDDDDKATIPCVMWKYAAKTVMFPVMDGALVRATGYVDFYPPYGKMQFVIKKLESIFFGRTGLYLQKEEWKKQLTAEGVIPRSEGVRRLLPIFPSCLGVVTSRTSSVLQDILNIVTRRYPLPILLAHTTVQGKDAHIQITAAIRSLQGKADVIIVARGGGSFEDLIEFNHPDVVRTIATSTIPIISAIGHETDTTLADYAADFRAPTPSAAAEMSVPDQSTLLYQLEEMRKTIQNMIIGRFVAERNTLADLTERIEPSKFLRMLDQMHQQIADFAEWITSAFFRRISSEREQCRTLGKMIIKSTRTRIATAQLKLLAQKESILNKYPYKPLELGYAIIWKKRVMVRSTKNISTGDRLALQFLDGKAIAIVESITYDRDSQSPDV